SIPTQSAIADARNLLFEAQKRIKAIGPNANDQINDSDLRQLTYVLYGKIPKIKQLGAPESTWILSKNNILAWQQDLDAFENAGQNINIDTEEDPLGGMKLDISWVDPKSDLGIFLYD